jgi:hypothetical protein
MSNFERNIFTNAKPPKLETLADIITALTLGALLAVGLIVYFDVLIK